jgi:hypothetical protein
VPPKPYPVLTFLQIQLIEAYLRIIVFSRWNSCFLEIEPFSCLLGMKINKNVPTQSGWVHLCKQLGGWYRSLLQNGFYWEAHRVLRSILPVLGTLPWDCFEDFFQILTTASVIGGDLKIEDIPKQSEQILIAELANASLLSFLTVSHEGHSAATVKRDCSEKAKALAALILADQPDLINSRPYLEWMFREDKRSHLRPLLSQRMVADRKTYSNTWEPSQADRWKYLATKTTDSVLEVSRAGADGYLPEQADHVLRVIIRSAEELGDHYTHKAVLQELIRRQGYTKNLEDFHKLTDLQNNTMADAIGFLESLIEQALLLEDPRCASRQIEERALCEQLFAFDRDFPFSGDFPVEVRKEMEHVFFDVPLFKWGERKVQYFLLFSLGRGVESELARLQSQLIEKHLPYDFTDGTMISGIRCDGTCAECKVQNPLSGERKETGERQRLRSMSTSSNRSVINSSPRNATEQVRGLIEYGDVSGNYYDPGNYYDRLDIQREEEGYSPSEVHKPTYYDDNPYAVGYDPPSNPPPLDTQHGFRLYGDHSLGQVELERRKRIADRERRRKDTHHKTLGQGEVYDPYEEPYVPRTAQPGYHPASEYYPNINGIPPPPIPGYNPAGFPPPGVLQEQQPRPYPLKPSPPPGFTPQQPSASKVPNAIPSSPPLGHISDGETEKKGREDKKHAMPAETALVLHAAAKSRSPASSSSDASKRRERLRRQPTVEGTSDIEVERAF